MVNRFVFYEGRSAHAAPYVARRAHGCLNTVKEGEFSMKILVVNAGSSSLKYQLFDMDERRVLAKGLCEKIGLSGAVTHKRPGKAT